MNRYRYTTLRPRFRDAELPPLDDFDDGQFWPPEWGIADAWVSLVAWTVRVGIRVRSA